MLDNQQTPSKSNEAMVYQIRLKGHLDTQWADWFDGFAIAQEEAGNTLLTGSVADQAVLHGLFKKIRDLGMPLLSVNCIDPAQTDEQDIENVPTIGDQHE